MPLVRTITAGCLLEVALAWAAVFAPGSEFPAFRVVHRGTTTLPQSIADRDGLEVPITGLSGITWLGDDRYAAIMDNSDKLLLFRMKIAPDGTPGEPGDMQLVTLSERHDYEDVSVCPEQLRTRIAARRVKQGLPDPGTVLLVCEEDTPAIRAVSLADGGLLGIIPIPEVFATRRPNRGLESLDIDPDGGHLWTANEEALPADGPQATVDGGTVVRLARIAIPEAGNHRRDESTQLAYAVDPPHHFVRVFTGEPLSGVAAVTGLGDGQLLVLERSGCPGLPPFENRLYLADTRSGRDATAVDRGLAERPAGHVAKALLWKDQFGCNMEGLCLGPTLRGNSRAVVAIADNNGLGTLNLILAFSLEDRPPELPAPTIAGIAALIVVSAGLAMLWFAR